MIVLVSFYFSVAAMMFTEILSRNWELIGQASWLQRVLLIASCLSVGLIWPLAVLVLLLEEIR